MGKGAQVYCWLHRALLSETAYIICSLLYNAHFCQNGIAKRSVLGLGMLVYCQTFEAWSSLVAVLVVVSGFQLFDNADRNLN